MKFIQIPLPPHLPSKWATVYKTKTAAVASKATHKLRSEYFQRNNDWGLLKNLLENVSGGKCWYCEAKSNRAPFDVDHFRPKLSVTAHGIKLPSHDGYYWLAYDWSNFRLSCQRCNRPGKSRSGKLHGKANEFPIQDEARRCSSDTDSLEFESPKLLDPCIESDCRLLAHGTDGEVKPLTTDKLSWDYERADYTIKQLGFNEFNSPETKRREWQKIAAMISSSGSTGNTAIIAVIGAYLARDHEYASFFRAVIGTHRDKPWVEALL